MSNKKKAFMIQHSFRFKLVLILLVTLILVGAITLGVVVQMQYGTTEKHARSIMSYIEKSIASKAQVLSENQAEALKRFVQDNAIVDLIDLVRKTVAKDADVVYGLYVSADLLPWVYVSPNNPDPSTGDNSKWSELGLTVGDMKIKKPIAKRERLFGQEIYAVAVPIFSEGEFLGTIRYGLSLNRVRYAVEKTRLESKNDRNRMVGTTSVFFMIVFALAGGFMFVVGHRLTRPIQNLTLAAQRIADGNLENIEIDTGGISKPPTCPNR